MLKIQNETPLQFIPIKIDANDQGKKKKKNNKVRD